MLTQFNVRLLPSVGNPEATPRGQLEEIAISLRLEKNLGEFAENVTCVRGSCLSDFCSVDRWI